MPKLKIGIIGSGFGQYGLLPAFNSLKNCEVVAICGERRPQLVAYCKKIGFTNIYSNWKLMLKNEQLDAVAIAVTPAAQYQIAKTAINQGLHVFAEKPLTVNVKQAKELLQLAQKKKITHGVDFIFPEIAEWKKVKNLLEQKTFGKLLHISTAWDFLGYDIKHKKSTWKTSAGQGGGALAFYFSHGLNYLEHFAGPITKISSVFSYDKDSNNGAETGVDLVLKFKNQITGDAHINCNSKSLTRHQLIFQCEKGVIVLNSNHGVVDNFTIKTYSNSGEKQFKIKPDRDLNNEDERVKIVRKLTRKFVNASLTKKPMSPSFKEGLRAQELIELIRKKTI